MEDGAGQVIPLQRVPLGEGQDRGEEHCLPELDTCQRRRCCVIRRAFVLV